MIGIVLDKKPENKILGFFMKCFYDKLKNDD